MHRIKTIHFIGIGGTGMCGIAEVLLNEGYVISGSDLNQSAVTKRLESLGAKVFVGHQAENIKEVDVVVKSTAVTDDNPEIIEAKKQKLPIVPRAEMLAELMRFRHGIAIAGTHGKTTTTSLTASILAEAGMDPTFIIGGRLIGANTNAKLGKSQYLVAEADESDASFLFLNPLMSVITNIDADHLENYQGEFSQVKKAFVDFIHRLPFYGLATLCIDDDVIQELMEDMSRPVITYGFSDNADFQLSDYHQKGSVSYFNLNRKNAKPLSVELNLPGKHNALNATAAIILALELGVEEGAIQEALKHFQGVGRRFQDNGLINLAGKSVRLIDDYAHHPVELAATITAAKLAWPEKRIVGLFQPHRYTRTRDLFDDFSDALSQLDELALLEVFAAGESLIEGADSTALAKNIRKRGLVEPMLVKKSSDVEQVLSALVKEGDILLTMGAGSIGGMSANLVKQCSSKSVKLDV